MDCARVRGDKSMSETKITVIYDNPTPGRPLVRWAFCKQPEVLQEAIKRLQKL